MHELLRNHRAEIDSGVRELALAERRLSEPDVLTKDDDDEVLELSDLNGDEITFIDVLREGDGLLKMSSGYETVEYISKGKKEEKLSKMAILGSLPKSAQNS